MHAVTHCSRKTTLPARISFSILLSVRSSIFTYCAFSRHVAPGLPIFEENRAHVYLSSKKIVQPTWLRPIKFICSSAMVRMPFIVSPRTIFGGMCRLMRKHHCSFAQSRPGRENAGIGPCRVALSPLRQPHDHVIRPVFHPATSQPSTAAIS